MAIEQVFMYDKDGGRFVPEKDAKVSVFDHGLLYGDSVFEGIRIYDSKIFKFPAHMKRLYESAGGIKLEIPLPIEELSDLVVDTCRTNELKETGYIRLVVTRGTGDLGLNPEKCPVPAIFAIAKSIQMYPPGSYTDGLDVIIAETTQKAFKTLSPNVKSGNYLNNVMAYNEIIAYNEKNGTNAREAIMLDQDGFIAECTGDNFFMVGFDPERKRHVVYTPGKRACLQGITRDTVRTIVNRLEDEDYLIDGYPIEYHETDVHPKDLKTKARELFLSGTAAEIVPVVRVLNAPLGDHEYGLLTVGDGKPGPITKLIMGLFKKETLKPENGTPIYEYTNEEFLQMKKEQEEKVRFLPQTVDDVNNRPPDTPLFITTPFIPEDHKIESPEGGFNVQTEEDKKENAPEDKKADSIKKHSGMP